MECGNTTERLCKSRTKQREEGVGDVVSLDFTNDLGVDLKELVKVDRATVITVSGVKVEGTVTFDQAAGHLAEEDPLCGGRRGKKRGDRSGKRGERRKMKEETNGGGR